jgi:hypothetical protein
MVINVAAELRAIEAALDGRLVIVHQIIDMNRNVIAEYRKTVLLPRGDKPHHTKR